MLQNLGPLDPKARGGMGRSLAKQGVEVEVLLERVDALRQAVGQAFIGQPEVLDHILVALLALLPAAGQAQQMVGFAAIDKADTVWVLVATALVLLMTLPGVALFYAGMVRRKNVLNTLAAVLGAVDRGYRHLMGTAEIRDRCVDAIFGRTQPHVSQQDQTAAALKSLLVEDP